MSDLNPIIRINIDTSDEIVKIHGIGPILAERIVNYRNDHGYFQSPEDLAKVDGISLQFAVNIASNIDWQLPSKEKTKESINWGSAFIYSLGIILILWVLISKLLPPLPIIIETIEPGNPYPWIVLFIYLFLSLVGISATVACISYLLMCFIMSNIVLASKLQKIGLSAAFGAIIFGLLSGIGHALIFSLSNSWNSLLSNYSYLAGIIIFISIAIGIFPFILLFWFPKLSTNSVFAHMYDISYLLLGITMAVYIGIYHNDFPLWYSITNGIIGIYLAFVAVSSIRNGYSNYYDLAEGINFLNRIPADDSSVWKKWINSHLPDPEQQKKLKIALDKMYPSSRLNTIIYSIIFGAGGWLILNMISSTIDWIISNILDKYFH